MIILEFGGPFQPLPGSVTMALDGRPFRRWWWAWWAVAYYPTHLEQFHKIVAAGKSRWINIDVDGQEKQT